jgi:hypothetical protein
MLFPFSDRCYQGTRKGAQGRLPGEMTRLDGPTSEMRLSLKKEAPRDSGRVWAGLGDQEAPPGFEPGMKVLQTSALPLGYGARKRRLGRADPGNGSFPL